MGLQGDKGDIFQKVNTFNVISGLPKTKSTNSLESISSKSKNLMPFLLDLLSSATVNNNKIKEKLTPPKLGSVKNKVPRLSKDSSGFNKNKSRNNYGGVLSTMLVDSLPKIHKVVKESAIEAIKSSLFCGTDFTIPRPAPELTVPIDEIDLNGFLKMDSSGPASVLFGETGDFNRVLQNVVNTKSNDVWDDNNGSPLLDMKYDGSTEEVTLKISDSRIGTSFHTFLIDYINSVKLVSPKSIMGGILDFNFGTISLPNNIGFDTLLDLAKMDGTVDKIIETDFFTDKVVIDDSFYEFTDEELNEFERQSRNKMRGVNVLDLGCGLIEVTVPPTVLEDLNEIDSTSSPKLVKDVIERTIDTVGESISSSVSDKDKFSVKANFNKLAILSLPKVLTRSVVTPKIISLYEITNKTVNSTTSQVKSGFDFSKFAKVFFKLLVIGILSVLLAILFDKIKKELLSLINRVVLKIVKEKVTLYTNAVISVFLNKVGSSKLLSGPNSSNLV